MCLNICKFYVLVNCTPGTTFKKDCNTCICAKDGKNAACTLMACPQGMSGGHNPNAIRPICIGNACEYIHLLA